MASSDTAGTTWPFKFSRIADEALGAGVVHYHAALAFGHGQCFNHQVTIARRPPQAIKTALLIHQKWPEASPKQWHNKAPKACAGLPGRP